MKYQKFPGGFAPGPPIFSLATILKSLPGHYLGKVHPQVTRLKKKNVENEYCVFGILQLSKELNSCYTGISDFSS